jgi:cytoskeletal protein CcmA (bactofilin family)
MKINNNKTFTNSAYLLFFALLLASHSGYAQGVSNNIESTIQDLYTINSDNSDSDASLRLQNTDGNFFNHWMIFNHRTTHSLHISNYRNTRRSTNEIGRNLFTFRRDISSEDGLFGINIDRNGPQNGIDLHFGQDERTGYHPTGRSMYVTGRFGASSDGIEFRQANSDQGIGFGYNTIYATGGIQKNQELNLQSLGTGNISLRNGENTALHIQGSNQFVGIGTTLPQKELDVRGDAKITGTLDVQKLLINGQPFGGSGAINNEEINTKKLTVTNSAVVNGTLDVQKLLINGQPFGGSGELPSNIALKDGNNNGIRFWGNQDTYKISMGATESYKYGPVNSFSIKNNMPANMGFTWGQYNRVPIAALNGKGEMQLAKNLAIGGRLVPNTALTVNGDGKITGTLDVQELLIDGQPFGGSVAINNEEINTKKLTVTNSAVVNGTLDVQELLIHGQPFGGSVAINNEEINTKKLTVTNSAVVNGTLDVQELLIDGQPFGGSVAINNEEINTKKLTVTNSAVVNGTLDVQELLINGQPFGGSVAINNEEINTKKLTVTNSAVVNGTLDVQELLIDGQAFDVFANTANQDIQLRKLAVTGDTNISGNLFMDLGTISNVAKIETIESGEIKTGKMSVNNFIANLGAKISGVLDMDSGTISNVSNIATIASGEIRTHNIGATGTISVNKVNVTNGAKISGVLDMNLGTISNVANIATIPDGEIATGKMSVNNFIAKVGAKISGVLDMDTGTISNVANIETIPNGEIRTHNLFSAGTVFANTLKAITGAKISGVLDMSDAEIINTRALQLKDWDNDTGGADNKYRLLARDGAWMFYNGGVAVGEYYQDVLSDVPTGRLIVKKDLVIGDVTPVVGSKLTVNGKATIKGALDVEELLINGLPFGTSGVTDIEEIKTKKLTVDGKTSLQSLRTKSLYVRGKSVFRNDINMTDRDIKNVRALKLRDWDDNTGGLDNKYRLLARDGAWMYYDGGVVIGAYPNNTWSDVPTGRLVVQEDMVIGDVTPINGSKLTVDGRVYISDDTTDLEKGFGSGFATNDNYKEYLLWVEEGIVSNDIAIVETSGWPDYVFAKDYKLNSIKELEQHILEEGHLPNFPSAEEVETMGYSLDDMTKRLLKTVEEMILHTIQQEKKIDTQNSMMQQLIKRLEALENK